MKTIHLTLLVALTSFGSLNAQLVPTLLKDIEPGTGSSLPNGLTLFRDRVYFSAFAAQSGRELWVTDGTPAGTSLFVDIFPGALASSPLDLCVLGDRMFFAARGNNGAGTELWVTDGTAAGTRLFADLRPGSADSSPRGLTRVGDRIYFSAEDGSTGREPWVTDGTLQGTYRLADVNPGAAGSDPTDFAGYPGQVVFAANDGGAVAGTELWLTDGTAAGTALLADLANGPASGAPSGMHAFGGQVYFAADDGRVGRELWRTDFTPGGTGLYFDLNPGAVGSDPVELQATAREDQNFLFIATISRTGIGRTIFACDGTPAGIALAYPGGVNMPSPLANIYPAGLDMVGSRKLYFGGTQGSYRGALWVVDTTRDPFNGIVAFNINPNGFSNPGSFVLLRDQVLFHAYDASIGIELWRIPNGATERPVDQGCSGSRLDVRDPVIGSDVYYSLQTDIPSAAPLSILGRPLPSPVLLPQVSTCPLHVDPAGAIFTAYPAGWNGGTFPIPGIVQLSGITLVMQFFMGSTTVPTAYDFTNPVYLHLGF